MSYTGLHPEQRYVFEIAGELGITPKILHHKTDTKTCLEKLELLKEENPLEFLDWTLNRIVKALYFSRNGFPLIGVITPEFGKSVKTKEIISSTLEVSRSKAEKYWASPNHVPRGMSWGTCTPFPLESSMVNEISDLIVINHPSVDDKLVDISIGGLDEKSFMTSMHLPYGAIYEILKNRFGERIHLYKD